MRLISVDRFSLRSVLRDWEGAFDDDRDGTRGCVDAWIPRNNTMTAGRDQSLLLNALELMHLRGSEG
jgi:hypothetical protein